MEELSVNERPVVSAGSALTRTRHQRAMSVWFVRKCFTSKQIQDANDQLSKFVGNDKVVTPLTNRRTLVIKEDFVRCLTIKSGLSESLFDANRFKTLMVNCRICSQRKRNHAVDKPSNTWHPSESRMLSTII